MAEIKSTPTTIVIVGEGQVLTSLTLHATLGGTLPYLSCVYPLEGTLPSGFELISPDDASLRSSVISRWPDGSAAVVVIAGEATVAEGSSTTLRLALTATSAAPQTPARVGQLLQSVAFDFGAEGSASLTSFATPERTWWSSSQVICCRYRVAIGASGLEAVIDIHAFASNRAFVEVVVENGSVDANAANVAGPAVKTYDNATVSVNGAIIATVSSPSTDMPFPNARQTTGLYIGGHEPFRAWYCSTWVGGDPGIEVTHDPAFLQAHPWFFRAAEASAEDLQAKYAKGYDTYVPWATCRLRLPGMDSTGDDEEIALFTECQTDYFLSGNRYARRAVIASGLAPLSADINWRDKAGEVPSHAQLAGKNTTLGTWPRIKTEPRWGGSNTNDGSHTPAIALVPFLCRPSPCFIEIAQKELAWNHTNYSSVDGSHPYDQARSRAWRLRNYGIAIFLTPDADAARKDGYRKALVNSMNVVNVFLDKPWNTFQVLYDPTANDPGDHSTTRAKTQSSFFMHHFGSQAFHAVAGAKVLRGADAVAWDTLADRMMVFPLRWINDATSFEWRAIPYQPTTGVRVGDTIDQSPGNLSTLTKDEMSGTVPNAPGPWMNLFPNDHDWGALATDLGGGISYPAFFFAALCAAVERDVPGAAAAWDKVVTSGGITNFATWRKGYRTAPRFNRWPRNR